LIQDEQQAASLAMNKMNQQASSLVEKTCRQEDGMEE
jgi:hypothetical protein